MPDGTVYPPIEAGRESRAHLQLSRMLWLRQRGKPYRYRFDLGSSAGLTIEPFGPATPLGEGGVLLIDRDDGMIFGTQAEPAEFLRGLAAWAKQNITTIPALATLADSGAINLPAEPQDAAAAQALDPAAVGVTYHPALWDDLLVPDPATMAAALAALPVGERMWFWMTHDTTADSVPLVVQPLAWDPNHDRTDWLVARNLEAGAGPGTTGTCSICDDGTMQFLGEDLYPLLLPALASWVARHVAEYPALARLADCRLLLTSDAVIDRVYADASLWTSIPRQSIPGTLAATAALLDTLEIGGECWFWITGGPTEAGLLYLSVAADDPEGTAFRAELPHLYARFPQSFRDAISGIMTKVAADRLLFVSQDARVEPFAAQVTALLDRYASQFPALQALAGASLVKSGAGGSRQIVSVAAE